MGLSSVATNSAREDALLPTPSKGGGGAFRDSRVETVLAGFRGGCDLVIHVRFGRNALPLRENTATHKMGDQTTVKKLMGWTPPTIPKTIEDRGLHLRNLEALPMRLPRVRFTVRRMMIAMAVFGGGLGWYLTGVRAQRDAVAEIRHLGGYVWYEYGAPYPIDRHTATLPRLKHWAGGLIGPDFVANVGGVEVPHLVGAAGAIDRANRCMFYVSKLKHVESVSLSGWPVTDDGLLHAEPIVDLQYFDLSGTRVTDVGVKNLRKYENLVSLGLQRVRVTDAGLSSLSGLKKLTELSLAGTDVTDAGLTSLHGHPSLKELEVCDTKVTDKGVVNLLRKTSLNTIHLSRSQLTNYLVNNLREFGELKEVIVEGSGPEDAEIAEMIRRDPRIVFLGDE